MEEKKAAPVKGLNSQLRFINNHGNDSENAQLKRAISGLKTGVYTTTAFNQLVAYLFSVTKARIKADLQ